MQWGLNLHIIILLVFLVTAVRCDSSEDREREYCKDMRRKYNIIPGESFGTLPQNLHNKYLNARCHRFFCQPHPMSGMILNCLSLLCILLVLGKGKFKCKYLPGVQEEFDKLSLIPS